MNRHEAFAYTPVCVGCWSILSVTLLPDAQHRSVFPRENRRRDTPQPRSKAVA